jgi:hypothetical protein
MNTFLSATVALIAAIFLMWLNGRQHEFDQLEDK